MSTRGNVNRRQLMRSAAAVTLAGSATALMSKKTTAAKAPKGRIRQSIVHWCFGSRGEKWDIGKTCSVARELGYQSVELVAPEDFPTLKSHGLTCAIAGVNIQPGCNQAGGFEVESVIVMPALPLERLTTRWIHAYPSTLLL